VSLVVGVDDPLAGAHPRELGWVDRHALGQLRGLDALIAQVDLAGAVEVGGDLPGVLPAQGVALLVGAEGAAGRHLTERQVAGQPGANRLTSR